MGEQIEKDSGCLFCKHTIFKESFYDSTLFNKKKFEYKECQNCYLIQLSPLPTEEDLMQMYSSDYQINTLDSPEERFNVIFELLGKVSDIKTIVDFGCGNGNFVKMATDKGFEAYGVEFNPETVKFLQEKFNKQIFYSNQDFFSSSQRYDLILVDNVIEHLTNPREILKQIKAKLNLNGVIIARGPLENNISLSFLMKKLVFSSRKSLLQKPATHIPYHITFSNYENQKYLFESIGFSTNFYEITESAWPFPKSLREAKTLKQRIQYFLFRASKLFSANIIKWGNTFIYMGKS